MKDISRFISKNHLLLISSGILLFSAITIFLFTGKFYEIIGKGSIWVREWFGGFYLWLGLGCVILLLVIAFSKAGKQRLGNSKPEFTRWSWIAMLYSAGMGAGILLRSVQEPVYMFLNNPIKTNSPKEVIALEYTFYQWGFTAWAFYAVFALLMGYSLFIKKRPMRLGCSLNFFQRNSILSSGIDLLTILTTVTGLVAAVALGTSQIEGGLSHLFSKPPGNLKLTMALVFLVCLCAFFSAWFGMKKGIKKISNLNIYMTIGLLLFVLLQNDVLLIISLFTESLYNYILDFVPLSLALQEYDPGKEFLTDWTYYYWAFWLAWAPFTGIFISRISKGRTIREMILAVLIIPSIGTFFWFSVFGTASFELLKEWGEYQNEFSSVFTSLFNFLSYYQFPVFSNSLSVLLLISFLVTSVDSAIYVLSMFTSGGSKTPGKKDRLIWALIILIFSEALIVLGNFKAGTDVLMAMQKLLVIASLPFAFFSAVVITGLAHKLLLRKF